MRLKSFLKLVEIRTKAASMIPFISGTLYAVYRFGAFDPINFILMLVSLLAFDMATTAINNYIDYKKAMKTTGYGYEHHNAIVRDSLKEHTVLFTIALLLILATGFGIALFLKTGLVVLMLGMVSFFVGIVYTFGPVPISRMPLGEIFSGLILGFVNILISAYIHTDASDILTLEYSNGMLRLSINLWEMLLLFLFSLPAVFGIANIMLANNICDIEDDMENKRYTLPVYIGRERSLKLFAVLYYAAIFDVILLIILGVLPYYSVLALLIFIPVIKNIRLFNKKQTKKDTFSYSVLNFLLINSALIISVAAAITLGK